ncbi:MAG: FMN-binding glutamate synthase family protein [Gammaproteobacteria bacterium]|nr:MAG: FMN-binding glutamate synthase family protein [Gammaproteobacteria bacterium]
MTLVSDNWVYITLELFAAIFVIAIGVGLITLAALYIADITQTKQTIRRNYPIVGRFRYFFEHMGEFFRQYFFAMDREELPFNRAERSWCYRAAKDVDSTIAFGSTKDIRPTGSIFFVNCPYPTLGEDAVPPAPVTIGPDCKHPYTTASLINISGMSFGALSKPAIRALSRGAKAAGCWMNTGEGGMSPYHQEGEADLVFQIGTAKFGVRSAEGGFDDDKLRELAQHPLIKMFEIKLSQGAKPGKGGILPGIKVTPEIAAIRGIQAGDDAISPNRHPDIGNADDLLDMIEHVRSITGRPVGFKTVIGDTAWLDELFSLILLRGVQSAPDFITVDGGDGGTGAAPMSLMDQMGLPLRESLPMLVDKLQEFGLRERTRVIASGKLINPPGVAWALATGADFVVSARGFLFALGCIQALQCNKNTCPTGITTHNKKLQHGLDVEAKAVRVANFVKNIQYEVGIIAHSCGVQQPRKLNRHHVRVVQENGKSIPLDEIYPNVHPKGLASEERLDLPL